MLELDTLDCGCVMHSIKEKIRELEEKAQAWDDVQMELIALRDFHQGVTTAQREYYMIKAGCTRAVETEDEEE